MTEEIKQQRRELAEERRQRQADERELERIAAREDLMEGLSALQIGGPSFRGYCPSIQIERTHDETLSEPGR